MHVLVCVHVCMYVPCTLYNMYMYVHIFVKCVPVHVNIPHRSAFNNCISEDEPVNFETCRRRQNLKNWIKVLSWKMCISLVYVAQL